MSEDPCVFRSQTVVRHRRAGRHHDCGPHPLLRSLTPPNLANLDQRLLPVGRRDRCRKRDVSLLPFFSRRKKGKKKTGNLSQWKSGCNPPPLCFLNEKTCCCPSAEELHKNKNPLRWFYVFHTGAFCFRKRWYGMGGGCGCRVKNTNLLKV